MKTYRTSLIVVLVATLMTLSGCAVRSAIDDGQQRSFAGGVMHRAVPFDPAAAPPPPPRVLPPAERPAQILGAASPDVSPGVARTGEVGVQGLSPYVSATPNQSAAADLGEIATSAPASVPPVLPPASPPVMAPTALLTSPLSPAAQLGAQSIRVSDATGVGSVLVQTGAGGEIVISNVRD